MTTVEVYFDPACPWSWMTSRWVAEAAPCRDVAVRWRAFSLAIVENRAGDVPTPDHRVSLGALRVVEAVWADEGDEPIGRLYTEIGRRFHLEGDKSIAAVGAALEAAGLDPDTISAADDARWDAEIEGSMADAAAVVGDDVGVPVLVFHDGDEEHGISGPVMSPAPTGDDALDLWDHVLALSARRSFFELKRSRTPPPQFAPPPP